MNIDSNNQIVNKSFLTLPEETQFKLMDLFLKYGEMIKQEQKNVDYLMFIYSQNYYHISHLNN